MIDLNKAGAWSAVEQLEIAEMLRNPTGEMQVAGAERVRVDTKAINKLFIANQVFKAMIDTATRGEG